MRTLLITSLLLISKLTMAAIEFDEVRTSKTDLLNVNKLHCEMRLGSQLREEDRHSTVLEVFSFMGFGLPPMHFEHKEVRQRGCDQVVLDQLVDDSLMGFGHSKAKITLIKRTAKLPRIYQGKCMRNIQEQVEVDFGQGTILKSSLLGTLIDATGCF